jgi:cytoskeleton protein RodZ
MREGVGVMLEIGNSLREARHRRKLELAEVEKATRIRVQQLEALEHEQFDRLPPHPYPRSFLRE